MSDGAESRAPTMAEILAMRDVVLEFGQVMRTVWLTVAGVMAVLGVGVGIGACVGWWWRGKRERAR